MNQAQLNVLTQASRLTAVLPLINCIDQAMHLEGISTVMQQNNLISLTIEERDTDSGFEYDMITFTKTGHMSSNERIGERNTTAEALYNLLYELLGLDSSSISVTPQMLHSLGSRLRDSSTKMVREIKALEDILNQQD